MDNLIGERMKSEIFERLNNNKELTVRAVAVLYSDGTIDSIDQITNCMLSTHDGNDEIIISGKYHAFIAKGGS